VLPSMEQLSRPLPMTPEFERNIVGTMRGTAAA
jgi:hypothetical protein